MCNNLSEGGPCATITRSAYQAASQMADRSPESYDKLTSAASQHAVTRSGHGEVTLDSHRAFADDHQWAALRTALNRAKIEREAHSDGKPRRGEKKAQTNRMRLLAETTQSPETLAVLAEHDNKDVRLAAVTNPKVDPKTLYVLLNVEDDPEVRQAANNKFVLD